MKSDDEPVTFGDLRRAVKLILDFQIANGMLLNATKETLEDHKEPFIKAAIALEEAFRIQELEDKGAR